MILLPVQGQPLQARYSGLFTIEKKINDVDCVVYTPARYKEKCLCYVNVLKLYQERKSDEVMSSHVAVCPVVAEANHDMVGDAPKLTNLEAFQNLQRKLSHLTPEEQNDKEKLQFEFQHLFPDVPSCTTCIFMMLKWDLHSLVGNILTGLMLSIYSIFRKKLSIC